MNQYISAQWNLASLVADVGRSACRDIISNFKTQYATENPTFYRWQMRKENGSIAIKVVNQTKFCFVPHTDLKLNASKRYKYP